MQQAHGNKRGDCIVIANVDAPLPSLPIESIKLPSLMTEEKRQVTSMFARPTLHPERRKNLSDRIAASQAEANVRKYF